MNNRFCLFECWYSIDETRYLLTKEMITLQNFKNPKHSIYIVPNRIPPGTCEYLHIVNNWENRHRFCCSRGYNRIIIVSLTYFNRWWFAIIDTEKQSNRLSFISNGIGYSCDLNGHKKLNKSSPQTQYFTHYLYIQIYIYKYIYSPIIFTVKI